MFLVIDADEERYRSGPAEPSTSCQNTEFQIRGLEEHTEESTGSNEDRQQNPGENLMLQHSFVRVDPPPPVSPLVTTYGQTCGRSRTRSSDERRTLAQQVVHVHNSNDEGSFWSFYTHDGGDHGKVLCCRRGWHLITTLVLSGCNLQRSGCPEATFGAQ